MNNPQTRFPSNSTEDPTWAQAIKHRLATSVIGHKILCYTRTSSTSDIAKDLAGTENKEGVVIIAREQTQGRGRLHGDHPRKWYSPPGGLYASILLRPTISPNQAPCLSLVCAIAVTNVLLKQYNISAGIKWPNDVLINDKKICGVLAEGSTRNESLRYVIVGIGINVNVTSQSLRKGAQSSGTSMLIELGTELSITEVICHVLEEFEKLYIEFIEHDLSKLLHSYRSLLLTLGQWIKIQTIDETLEGIAQDIDSNGSLILQLADNSVRQIYSGEVIMSKRI